MTTEKLADNEFKVNVDVTNKSDITGKETVMLFIHGRSGSVCRRQKELKGFKKVEMNPHETRTVSFILDKKSFEVWSANKKYEVEESDVDIFVGGNPYELLHETVHTTAE